MTGSFGWLGRQMSKLADALANRCPREAALTFLAGLRRDVRWAFENESDPVTGDKWPPPKEPLGRKLLVKTGRMKEAALRAADNAQRVNASTLTVELSEPVYSAWQNNGTGRIPARRFFGASAATVEDAMRRYRAACVEVLVT